jgi:hypothetical protein
VLVVLDVGGGGVLALHLALEGVVLGEGDVAGAADGRGRRARLLVVGREGLGALGRELGDEEDVRRVVQVALAVAADELAVLCEADVALQHPGAHPSTC